MDAVMNREGGEPVLSEKEFSEIRLTLPGFILSIADRTVARQLLDAKNYTVEERIDEQIVARAVSGGFEALTRQECELIIFSPAVWHQVAAAFLKAFRSNDQVHKSWEAALEQKLTSEGL
jgi:hypothetical protein